MVWFVLWWGGYMYYADHVHLRGKTLMATMRGHRETWMRRMLARENRVVDSTILSSIMRSVTLFASTTIFILAGLVTMLGSLDKAQAVVTTLPFAIETSHALWEVKLLTMLVVFVFAFFKFAWSIRQFNYTIVLVGAAPAPDQSETPQALRYAKGAAEVITMAVYNFNSGLRAYYFGLAILSWFINPVLFALAVVWVVGVLYRREFRSKTLAALGAALPREEP